MAKVGVSSWEVPFEVVFSEEPFWLEDWKGIVVDMLELSFMTIVKVAEG